MKRFALIKQILLCRYPILCLIYIYCHTCSRGIRKTVNVIQIHSVHSPYLRIDKNTQIFIQYWKLIYISVYPIPGMSVIIYINGRPCSSLCQLSLLLFTYVWMFIKECSIYQSYSYCGIVAILLPLKKINAVSYQMKKASIKIRYSSLNNNVVVAFY